MMILHVMKISYDNDDDKTIDNGSGSNDDKNWAISDSSSRSAIYFFLSTPCRSEGLSDKAKMPVFKPSFIVDRKTCYEKIYWDGSRVI